MDNIIKKGTPTKERQLKIDKLFELQILDRDNIIYKSFKDMVESNKNVSYLFCEECAIRRNLSNGGKYKSSSHKNGVLVENTLKNELKDVDSEFYRYYNSLYARAVGGSRTPSTYTSEIVADAYMLSEALGKQRFNEIPFYGQIGKNGKSMENIQGRQVPIKLKEWILELLTDDDMEKIKTFIEKNHHGAKTIIKRNYKKPYSFDRPTKNNNVYVELDLTKPLDELTSFIKTLQDDYVKNNKIMTIYDLVGNDDDPFIAELHKYNIYKKSNRAKKSNLDILIDALFIYDCVKADLDEGSIIALLDNHHNPVKMNTSTLSSYYELAYDFIVNERYKEFISGYSTS